MKKFISILTCITIILSVFSGCISSVDSQKNSGVNENELNIYTSMEEEQLNYYLDEFKSTHPDVKISITRDTTGTITSRLIAEKDNPQADVIWGLASTSLLVLENQGMLEAYSPEGVEKILPQFKDSKTPTHWVGIDAWETCLLVNKEVLSSHGINEVPTSYYDLLDPKYKGLIAMSNPSSSGTSFITITGILQTMGEEKGWKYLEELDNNVGVYAKSGDAPAKSAESGEYGVGFSYGYRCIKSVTSVGTDILQAVFPKEGSGWDLEANALIKKNNIKNVSKEFLDWAINDNCMTKYSTNYPIVTNNQLGTLPEGYPSDPISQLVTNDLNWAANNRDDILNIWNSKFGSRTQPTK